MYILNLKWKGNKTGTNIKHQTKKLVKEVLTTGIYDLFKITGITVYMLTESFGITSRILIEVNALISTLFK